MKFLALLLLTLFSMGMYAQQEIKELVKPTQNHDHDHDHQTSSAEAEAALHVPMIESQIHGTWNTIKVDIMDLENLTQEQVGLMEGIKKGFLNTRFTFNPNGTCGMLLPSDKPEHMKALDFLQSAEYVFDPAQNKISMGERETLYTGMGIYVVSVGERTFFVLEETPIMLEVSQG